jgi:hypothetical protein
MDEVSVLNCDEINHVPGILRIVRRHFHQESYLGDQNAP